MEETEQEKNKECWEGCSCCTKYMFIPTILKRYLITLSLLCVFPHKHKFVTHIITHSYIRYLFICNS